VLFSRSLPSKTMQTLELLAACAKEMKPLIDQTSKKPDGIVSANFPCRKPSTIIGSASTTKVVSSVKGAGARLDGDQHEENPAEPKGKSDQQGSYHSKSKDGMDSGSKVAPSTHQRSHLDGVKSDKTRSSSKTVSWNDDSTDPSSSLQEGKVSAAATVSPTMVPPTLVLAHGDGCPTLRTVQTKATRATMHEQQDDPMIQLAIRQLQATSKHKLVVSRSAAAVAQTWAAPTHWQPPVSNQTTAATRDATQATTNAAVEVEEVPPPPPPTPTGFPGRRAWKKTDDTRAWAAYYNRCRHHADEQLAACNRQIKALVAQVQAQHDIIERYEAYRLPSDPPMNHGMVAERIHYETEIQALQDKVQEQEEELALVHGRERQWEAMYRESRTENEKLTREIVGLLVGNLSSSASSSSVPPPQAPRLPPPQSPRLPTTTPSNVSPSSDIAAFLAGKIDSLDANALRAIAQRNDTTSTKMIHHLSTCASAKRKAESAPEQQLEAGKAGKRRLDESGLKGMSHIIYQQQQQLVGDSLDGELGRLYTSVKQQAAPQQGEKSVLELYKAVLLQAATHKHSQD
jgi:hypothetical protein